MLGDEIVSIARRKRERLFHNGSRAESGDESEKEGERGREHEVRESVCVPGAVWKPRCGRHTCRRSTVHRRSESQAHTRLRSTRAHPFLWQILYYQEWAKHDASDRHCKMQHPPRNTAKICWLLALVAELHALSRCDFGKITIKFTWHRCSQADCPDCKAE